MSLLDLLTIDPKTGDTLYKGIPIENFMSSSHLRHVRNRHRHLSVQLIEKKYQEYIASRRDIKIHQILS